MKNNHPNLPTEALAILNSANSPEHTGPLTPYVERLCELLAEERALCDRLATYARHNYRENSLDDEAYEEMLEAYTAHRAKEANHGND